jgi:hypothetical protein
MSLGLRPALIAVLAVFVVVPSVASGSILVAENARKASLKVAANGDAEIRWTNSKGARQSLVVPFNGRVLPGATVTGKNVAKRSSRWKLPFKPVLRKARNGFFYSLQTWRPRPDKPAELRFSRWKGKPTVVTLGAEFNGTKEALSGRVVFRGKPVSGTSPTPSGQKLKIFVLLDCLQCAAGKPSGWTRIAGRPLKTKDGKFAITVQPTFEGSSYRAQLAGPNRGRHLGPDVRSVSKSVRPLAEADTAS